MASTITLSGDWMTSQGNKRRTIGTGNLGTYATNGVAVTATQFGLGVLDDVQVMPTAGYIFEFDKTNLKVKAYWQTDPANAGGANIALIEVANATNLAGFTFKFQALGY